jgi:hypothetical protein
MTLRESGESRAGGRSGRQSGQARRATSAHRRGKRDAGICRPRDGSVAIPDCTLLRVRYPPPAGTGWVTGPEARSYGGPRSVPLPSGRAGRAGFPGMLPTADRGGYAGGPGFESSGPLLSVPPPSHLPPLPLVGRGGGGTFRSPAAVAMRPASVRGAGGSSGAPPGPSQLPWVVPGPAGLPLVRARRSNAHRFAGEPCRAHAQAPPLLIREGRTAPDPYVTAQHRDQPRRTIARVAEGCQCG